MEEKEQEYSRNRNELSKIDAELNKFNREIQNIETELTKCKELYDRQVIINVTFHIFNVDVIVLRILFDFYLTFSTLGEFIQWQQSFHYKLRA